VSVVVVTGIIKALRYLYPIPPTFIAAVTTWHDVFSYVAVFMLGIHLAAILLVPRNWPLLVSMLTMRVSRKHVQTWHPLWEQELIAKETATMSAPSSMPQVAAQPAKETTT
jgi:hypothetical protein